MNMEPLTFRHHRPKLNGYFVALGCSARRRVLEQVRNQNTRPIDIAVQVGIRPSTVIYHLNCLREAGLIDERCEPGRPRIDHEAIDAVRFYVVTHLG